MTQPGANYDANAPPAYNAVQPVQQQQVQYVQQPVTQPQVVYVQQVTIMLSYSPSTYGQAGI